MTLLLSKMAVVTDASRLTSSLLALVPDNHILSAVPDPSRQQASPGAKRGASFMAGSPTAYIRSV
jgi:hypothetical protein